MAVSRRGGVVFSYLHLTAEVVSSLLFTPYLIRSLGQAEWGLYSLVASVTAYFLLLDAGVGNALVRYIAKFRVTGDSRQQQRLLGISLVFYTGVGVVVLLLGLVLRQNLPAIFGGGLTPSELARAGIMLNITLWNAAATLIFSAFDRVVVAYERFVLSKSLAIARLVVRVMTLTALLTLGYRAVAVVSANLALTVVFGLITTAFVLFRLNLRPAWRGLQFGFLREVIGYTSFIFLQMIATQVNAMSDQVLLGIMTTSATVGVYAVGAQLSTYFQSIAGSINGVLMPGVVRLVETGASSESLLAEMVKVGRLVFMVLGLLLGGFLVVGEQFVIVWAGAENADGYWVALILMSAMILYLTQAIGSQILWAMGRHKVQAILNVGVALANIGLTVVLIKWNPLIGASLGTAVAILIGNVAVMNIVFTKDIGVSMWQYYAGLFRGILPSLVLAVLAGLVVRLGGLSGVSGLVVGGLAILLVYGAAMIAFGLNNYEKGLLAPILRRTLPWGR